jgi:hypothetical protein
MAREWAGRAGRQERLIRIDSIIRAPSISAAYVLQRRIPLQLDYGIGTGSTEPDVIAPSPFHCGIEQLAGHSLTSESWLDLGVVDDGQRRASAAVGHFTDSLPVLHDEESPKLATLFMLDNTFHESPDLRRIA